jgi:hypothetical protein
MAFKDFLILMRGFAKELYCELLRIKEYPSKDNHKGL